jgi:hypothetical protein
MTGRIWATDWSLGYVSAGRKTATGFEFPEILFASLRAPLVLRAARGVFPIS